MSESSESALVPLDTGALEDGAANVGVRLSLAQLEQFRRYYRLLTEWNTRINLTAITDWQEVQRRHFVDSLAVAAAVPADGLAGGRIADIGSGAGFPGVPLKIAFPGIAGVLIDATGKKVEFLNNLRDSLKLDGLTAVHGRAEELGHTTGLREGFDLVLSRAVAPTPTLAELTVPFCRRGGLVVLHKTEAAAREVSAASHAIGLLGGVVEETVKPTLPYESRTVLVVIRKTGATPERYPRRTGVPRRRPLLEAG